ncbi:MAG: hypothetical protein H8D23_08445 [Candidatus Brocadiales bacterium]|nr:hypothetical protein [Candidatus Brocadiales bacterium]
MGHYDTAMITVSQQQAEMVVENLPFESSMVEGRLERNIGDDLSFILSNRPESNFAEDGNIRGETNVNIVCSDKHIRKELLEAFSSNRVVIEKRFHKPTDSAVVAKVTIHQGSKFHGLEGKYHLVTFETKGELVGGDHRVLVKDPLTFTFIPLNSVGAANKVTLLISRYEDNKKGKIALKDSALILPLNITVQVLSKSISTMKKPIRIIFTTK